MLSNVDNTLRHNLQTKYKTRLALLRIAEEYYILEACTVSGYAWDWNKFFKKFCVETC